MHCSTNSGVSRSRDHGLGAFNKNRLEVASFGLFRNWGCHIQIEPPQQDGSPKEGGTRPTIYLLVAPV